MRPIRISTGWSFVSDDISLAEQEQLGQLADGLEFSATTPERVRRYTETDFTLSTASIHLSAPPNSNISAVSQLAQYDFDTAVLHMTDSIDSLQKLQERHNEVPLTLENLDDQHSDAVERLQVVYKHTEYPFTIDVQHLLENYSVQDAIYVIIACSERIKQFHVSGRSGVNRHMLVHRAVNKSAVVELLKHIASFEPTQNIPWVIEGKYHTLSEVSKEMDYLRSIQAETTVLG